MKISLLLVPQIYILALFFAIFYVLEVNFMFGIWICGLRKLQEYKCSTSLLSRPLWREQTLEILNIMPPKSYFYSSSLQMWQTQFSEKTESKENGELWMAL